MRELSGSIPIADAVLLAETRSDVRKYHAVDDFAREPMYHFTDGDWPNAAFSVAFTYRDDVMRRVPPLVSYH
jgi:hypothetical protein